MNEQEIQEQIKSKEREEVAGGTKVGEKQERKKEGMRRKRRAESKSERARGSF